MAQPGFRVPLQIPPLASCKGDKRTSGVHCLPGCAPLQPDPDLHLDVFVSRHNAAIPQGAWTLV